FWAAVRQAWDDAIVAGNGVHLQQEAQTGSVTGAPLMDLAQSLADGETTEADAIAQARVLIAEATSAR
ncbi:MAG: hypothetical protein KKD26_01740, partial [Alphaproteobacteria bacterium]|nr:hypothetical protein [Alphaproteobacteria bacterium]